MTLLLLLACIENDPSQGILVGNPGEVSLQTASAPGLTFQSGEVDIARLAMQGCVEDQATVFAEAISVDLLGESKLFVPPGNWCSMTAELDSPLLWFADADDGWSLELSLDVQTLEVWSNNSFDTEREAFVLVIGENALDLGDLAPADGDDVLVIDETHPDHDALADAVFETLVLYDENEDVVASQTPCTDCEEALADTTESVRGCRSEDYDLQEAEPDPPTSSETAALPFLLLLTVGLRRRRKTEQT